MKAKFGGPVALFLTVLITAGFLLGGCGSGGGGDGGADFFSGGAGSGSVALHQAGNSGKCIFRPVVFVDIETVYDFKKCPDILS